MAPAPGQHARLFLPPMSAVRNTPPPSAPGPMLVPIDKHQGETPLPLGRLVTLVGSSPSARIYLPSKSVSRCHAVIINTAGGLFVRDLASRTQVRVNGRVVNEADLRDADVLQIGTFTFRFADAPARGARTPAPPVPAAALDVQGLDEPLPVSGRSVLIGRRETADVSLTENSASSAHALIFIAEGKHLLRDLNSRTGTYVNGVKIHEHALSPGDVVRVGETSFRYVRAGEAAAPAGDGTSEVEKSAIEIEPIEPEVLQEAPSNDGVVDELLVRPDEQAEQPKARESAEPPSLEPSGAPLEFADSTAGAELPAPPPPPPRVPTPPPAPPTAKPAAKPKREAKARTSSKPSPAPRTARPRSPF